MEVKELGKILKEMYNNAPRGELVTMVHLFGVKYSNDIKQAGVKEVIKEAGILSTYFAELSKAVKLSKYVVVRQ